MDYSSDLVVRFISQILMSVKKVVICVIKYVSIPMVRTYVSALMATHWASIEFHVLVSPLIILCL